MLWQSFAALRRGARRVNVCPRTSRSNYGPNFCRQAPAPRAQRRWNHQSPWPIPSRDEVDGWFRALELPVNASVRQMKDAHRRLALAYNTDQKYNPTADKVAFQKVY